MKNKLNLMTQRKEASRLGGTASQMQRPPGSDQNVMRQRHKVPKIYEDFMCWSAETEKNRQTETLSSNYSFSP